MLLAGLVIVYSFLLLLATCAFWFVKLENVLVIFQALFGNAGRWPVTIFPPWLRAFLTFVVPVAFAVTVPAQALTGQLEAARPCWPSWSRSSSSSAPGCSGSSPSAATPAPPPDPPFLRHLLDLAPSRPAQTRATGAKLAQRRRPRAKARLSRSISVADWKSSAQTQRTTCQPRSRSRSSLRFSSNSASSGDCPGRKQQSAVLLLPVELAKGPRLLPAEVAAGDEAAQPVEDLELRGSAGGSRCSANTTRLIDSPGLSLRGSSKAAVRRARAMPWRRCGLDQDVAPARRCRHARPASAASPMGTASSGRSAQARSSTVRDEAGHPEAVDLGDVVRAQSRAMEMHVASDPALPVPVLGQWTRSRWSLPMGRPWRTAATRG